MNNNKAMLIVTSVSVVGQERERKDGKVSRKYVTVGFSEAVLDASTGRYNANPFRTSVRNIFERHNADGTKASWRVSPEQLNSLKDGKIAIPGEIITAKVESFPVLGADGKQSLRKDGSKIFADRYTAVVLNGEDANTIFAAQGHKIVETSTAIVAEAPISNLMA